MNRAWIFLLTTMLLVALVGWQKNWIVDLAKDKLTPVVMVRSQVEEIKLASVKAKLIETVLTEAGFFESGRVINYKSNGLPGGMVTVRKVQVILTPDEQILGKTFGAGESTPYQSWGIEYSPTNRTGVADIAMYLYVKPEIVENEESAKLATRYQSMFLRAVWDLTHPRQHQDEVFERFAGMSDWVKSKTGEMWWEVVR